MDRTGGGAMDESGPDWARVAVLAMAGGSGLRLWPWSRRDRPKPFLNPPSGGPSMLRRTVERVRPLVRWNQVFVNVTRGVEGLVRTELPELRPDAIVSAPSDRDTLPSVLFAGAHVAAVMKARQVEDPVLVLLASDNLVAQDEALRNAIARSVLVATSNSAVVAIGVKPTRAATEYGYMELGAEIAPGVHRGLRYHEKPQAELAGQYFQSSCFDWNAGMFVVAWSTLLKAVSVVDLHTWEVTRSLCALPLGARRQRDRAFTRYDRASLDTALMEPLADELSVPTLFVRARTAWDDLGSHEAMKRHAVPAGEGCSSIGSVHFEGSHNCLGLAAPGQTVRIQGGSNLVVAVGDNGDVLVSGRDREARMRALLDMRPRVAILDAPDGFERRRVTIGGVAVSGACRALGAERVRVTGPTNRVVGLLDVRDLTVTLGDDVVRVDAGAEVHCHVPPSDRIAYCENALDFGDHLAKIILDEIGRALEYGPVARIVLSAGSTPTSAYARLAADHADDIDWGRVHLYQMDEWAGISPSHPRSFARYLREHVVKPLAIGYFVELDGRMPVESLRLLEDNLIAAGGLDVAVHGIGENGHLGFNEPGAQDPDVARRVVLAPSTVMSAHRTGFVGAPSWGITLGFRSLDTADRVVLAAAGEHKRDAITSSLLRSQGLGPCMPASRLREHGGLRVVLDRDAVPT